MLGYDLAGKNVYMAYNCESGRIESRKNVKFDESVDYDRNENEPMKLDHRFKYAELDGETLRDQSQIFETFDQAHTVGEIEFDFDFRKNTIELPRCPKSVKDALEGKDSEKWEQAIWDELEQIVNKDTLMRVEIQQGARVAKMRMVLQVSFDNEFNVKYKARLVVCGYSQVYGIDYKETYSSTISRDSLLIVLYIALVLRFKIEIIDVKGAFLEGKNRHEVLAEIPKEILPMNSPKMIVRIINSLYGEKQAAFEWFQRLKEILVDIMEFEQLINDECIFVWRANDQIEMILTIHVDDIIVAGKSTELIQAFKDEFRRHVTDIKEFKEVKKYLGLEIDIKENKIELKQTNYIKDIENIYLKDLIPNERKMNLLSPNYPLREDQDDEEVYNLLKLTGKLRYLADCTRPDLLTFLSVISSKASKANSSYVDAAKEGVQFVQNTKNWYFTIGNGVDPLEVVYLYAFCDGSHNNKIDGCDRVGGCFFLGYNTGAFYSFTKKDKTISTSPMAAEIKAIERTVQLITIYRDLLEELGFKQMEPTPIFTDSQSAVKLFKFFKNAK
jgi:hypothetical protein